MLLPFLCALAHQEVASYELYRGAPIANQQIAYWSMADTYLDSRMPDRNFGGEGVLLGGPGRTILLQFGDLRRVLGANKVRKASLELTTSGGEQPALKSIARVNVPWGEGPLMTLGALLERNMKERTKKEGEVEAPPRWAATWKARRAGEGGLVQRKRHAHHESRDRGHSWQGLSLRTPNAAILRRALLVQAKPELRSKGA